MKIFAILIDRGLGEVTRSMFLGTGTRKINLWKKKTGVVGLVDFFKF